MAKKEHGPLYEAAKRELQLAGMVENGKSPAETSIYHTTLKLVDTFEKGSKSEFTASVIRATFNVLSDGGLIEGPINDPSDWLAPDEQGRIVNSRSNKIFTNDGGKTWFQLDGTAGVSKDPVIKEASDGSETKETV